MKEQMHILVVDDDIVDVEAVSRAFADCRFAKPIRVANDGLEALQMLRGENGHEKLKRPNIILLDINMPRMDGHQFLEALRADPALRDAVVYLMTTSKSQDDIQRAYSQNVAGYLVKSDLGDDLEILTELLGGYWKAVVLPTVAPSSR